MAYPWRTIPPYKFRIISAAWSRDAKLPERATIMTSRRFAKAAAGVAAFAAIIFAGMLSSTPRVKATRDDDEERNDSRVHRGLEIAPVPPNMDGKNRALVGLGSYIFNEHVPCKGCT